MTDDRPRWHYRFDNYRRAFDLLSQAVAIMDERPLSPLEKEGTIQRFEYTWELAWKLLKDYLEDQGIILDKITPAATIKSALAAKIITQGDLWMQALDARNKMAHTYNQDQFEQITQAIRKDYLALFEDLHEFMLQNTPQS
jgi:nucleotidyltransferase substrate binding protein (TIGR01987 family)